MKRENKRIFINDLPETFTHDELVTSFSKYGQVSSVDIKERKELGPNNKSLFFAYVNLITDDKGINECFQKLSNSKWHGQYVELQIARESFLERLKREREENQKNNQHIVASEVASNDNENTVKSRTIQNGLNYSQKQPKVESIHKKGVKKYESSTESEDEPSKTESVLKIQSKPVKIKHITQDTTITTTVSEPEEIIDIVIKSNRGKIVDKNGLKIPSLGKEPIIKITNIKSKINDSQANLKRLQSIRDMKKSYVAQKSLIKNSLSYGVNKPNNKIIFDADGTDTSATPKINSSQNKNSLFDDNRSDEDSDFEGNFEVKEQFEGKSGQKLLELQSKYKNDKRFALDKRFIDANLEEGAETMQSEDMSEETIQSEKRTELKILEDVLGKKLRPTKEQNKQESEKKKTMLRFDPSQPGHVNLELTRINSEENKKKNKKDRKKEVQEELNPEPEVSKEVFYKVTDNLKETFEEKQQFSLLSMFGKHAEDEDILQEDTEKKLKRNPLIKGQNPFKYDSSDDEDETADIPHKNLTESSTQIPFDQKPSRSSPAVFWTEPFFFKPDDFRLQEGFDFIERIKTENKEFGKIRRDVKGIVKAKVKNNERKNKMFKKKLGGSKRRKHIRMKKALKR